MSTAKPWQWSFQTDECSRRLLLSNGCPLCSISFAPYFCLSLCLRWRYRWNKHPEPLRSMKNGARGIERIEAYCHQQQRDGALLIAGLWNNSLKIFHSACSSLNLPVVLGIKSKLCLQACECACVCLCARAFTHARMQAHIQRALLSMAKSYWNPSYLEGLIIVLLHTEIF